mgnify:CR=1 FL=1
MEEWSKRSGTSLNNRMPENTSPPLTSIRRILETFPVTIQFRPRVVRSNEGVDLRGPGNVGAVTEDLYEKVFISPKERRVFAVEEQVQGFSGFDAVFSAGGEIAADSAKDSGAFDRA